MLHHRNKCLTAAFPPTFSPLPHLFFFTLHTTQPSKSQSDDAKVLALEAKVLALEQRVIDMTNAVSVKSAAVRYSLWNVSVQDRYFVF